MKCVRFTETGEPTAVLNCVDAGPPVLTNGSVRVRMLASPINPSDLLFVRGKFGQDPVLPQSPGFEGVGIVEAADAGLRGRLLTGRRVAVLNRAGGNWAEQVVLPATQVIPLSDSLSVSQAATFFVNPATAWVMTQEVLKVRAGQWLLQTAGGSTLGRMIIRLGKTLGFRTLSIVRRTELVDELRSLGATQVIVWDAENGEPDELRSQIRTLTDGQPIRAAIDPVGGATTTALIESLDRGGRLLVYGTLAGQPISISSRKLMTSDLSVQGFWLRNFMAQRGLLFKLRLVRKITRLILDGTLKSTIVAQCSLDQITDAVTSAEQNSGKTLLQISTQPS